MRILIAEDDFISRRLLHAMLAPWGDCELAAHGGEALTAIKEAWSQKRAYDLICLDIMMPVLDGQELLKELRRLEGERGIWGSAAAKVLMTTAVEDREMTMDCFRSQCEGYLVKPIQSEMLYRLLREFGFQEPAGFTPLNTL